MDNLPVFLMNTKRQWVQKTFTANGGRFEFLDVAPGSYILYTRRLQTKSRVERPVRVLSPISTRPLEDIKELELHLKLPPPEEKEKEKKKKLASISGSVVEGPRPQPGVPVKLVDANKKEVKTTTTDNSGNFVFNDVEKGNYTVVANKSGSRTKGQQAVAVDEAEKKSGVNIKLFR